MCTLMNKFVFIHVMNINLFSLNWSYISSFFFRFIFIQLIWYLLSLFYILLVEINLMPGSLDSIKQIEYAFVQLNWTEVYSTLVSILLNESDCEVNDIGIVWNWNRLSLDKTWLVLTSLDFEIKSWLVWVSQSISII